MPNQYPKNRYADLKKFTVPRYVTTKGQHPEKKDGYRRARGQLFSTGLEGTLGLIPGRSQAWVRPAIFHQEDCPGWFHQEYLFRQNEMPYGAAHGNIMFTPLSFDWQGKPFSLMDLFETPQGILETLSGFYMKAFNENNNRGLTPDIKNFPNFLITPTGLTFQFDDYQIGSHADGLKSGSIPLAALKYHRPKSSIWPGVQTYTPGFDCSRAAGAVEKTICANPLLSKSESELSAKKNSDEERKTRRASLKKECGQAEKIEIITGG